MLSILELKGLERFYMRNYNDPRRFEKEVTDEPEKIGEQAPAMGTDTSGWDQLKDVPFRGDKSVTEVERQSQAQEQEEEFEQEM